MKIPFSPPDITEAEIEQVAEALRSGWITTGPKTKELEREVASFKIGLLLKKAREEKKLTQLELAGLVDKKREYISRIENNGGNLTLKTLFHIVEKGLGGKVKISIEV